MVSPFHGFDTDCCESVHVCGKASESGRPKALTVTDIPASVIHGEKRSMMSDRTRTSPGLIRLT